MASPVKVPDAGQTTSEFQVLHWSKEVGEAVKRGEVLFEIETDKAALEVESFRDGFLLAVLAPVGSMVSTGQVVAYIGELGEEVPEEKPVSGMPDNRVPPDQKAEKPSFESISVTTNRVLASPAARALAKKRGIPLERLTSKTGKPIKKIDVETTGLLSEEGVEFTDLPLTEFRRSIVRRMTQSQRDVPQFTLEISLDLTEFEQHRKNAIERLGKDVYRVSINDYLIVAVARAVREVPLVNAQFKGDAIRQFHQVNVGLAVATDQGLIVPVIRNVNSMSLEEVAAERIRLVERAKAGKLDSPSITGASITLTNLGALGIDRFQALVNPPEAAILALGRMTDRVVGVGGLLGLRKIAFLNGSFDHRVVDGAEAARFLQKIKYLLENSEAFSWFTLGN